MSNPNTAPAEPMSPAEEAALAARLDALSPEDRAEVALVIGLFEQDHEEVAKRIIRDRLGASASA